MSTLNCLKSEDNHSVLGNTEIQSGILGEQHEKTWNWLFTGLSVALRFYEQHNRIYIVIGSK